MVHTVTDEFNNIQSWAAKNNLKIHPSKTKEIIFYRRRSNVQYPSEPFIPGAERVDALRVLGVIPAPRLSMGAHLDRVISNCASSRFALRTLKAHGLSPPELHLVMRMTTVSSLMHASPSWWASPTRQIGRDSNASWRVLDGPGFFQMTLSHSTNLHGMLTLACSS